jgi:uncharacterized protein (DUF983 family)
VSVMGKFKFEFSCPSCDSPGQGFSFIKSPERVVKGRCDQCGIEIESALGYGKYFVFLIYVHLILAMTGFPFVLALLGERWVVAIVSFLVFFLLVWVPAMILHSRNVAVFVQRPKSYGRKN